MSAAGSEHVGAALAALQAGKIDSAIAAATRACDRAPRNADAWQILSLAQHRAGLLDAAIENGRRSIALAPRTAPYHANLGVILRAAERFGEAEAECRAAISCDPTLAAAHHNLGNLLRDRGEPKQAESCYRQAIAHKPDYADAWRNLGGLLQAQGRFEEACAAFRTALAGGESAGVLSDLATSLMALDRVDEAHQQLRRAIAIDPRNAAAHGNLGALLLRAGLLFEAREATKRACELEPAQHRWVSNLATIAKDLNDWDEAEALFRKALALKPDYVSAHANLLFCLNYHPDKKAEEIFAEYRRFDAQHARKYLPAEKPASKPLAGRRLRLGLLSPDFREHSARHFIEPLLLHRDRSRIELFCYAEVPHADATTQRFKRLSDHWRTTVGLSDVEVAALIRSDQLDVLMDLGGHTSASRIMAMAHRPAPVQIAYLLGHGYTSGLSAIDVFLADDHLAPQGSDHLFSEKVVRLTRIPIAYMPPEGMPEPAPLPALRKGRLTFGYFGRPERLNDRVVSLWSEVLKKVPGSRLMLNAKAFREAAFCELMRERFAACGIEAEKLELVYTSPQPKTWEAYDEVDIALDPYPHNAGTTTIEALWLGVPVLTLKDRPSVGCFGASILSSVGLGDWIAESAEEYVSKSVTLTKDLSELQALRASLRQRFRASPLADGQGLATALEQTFTYLVHESNRQADPGAIEAQRASANSLDAAGNLNQAALEWRRILAAQPNDTAAWVSLSDVLRRLGRLAESEQTACKALELSPDFTGAALALGNALTPQNRLLEAEAAFALVLEQEPANAMALNNRALSLMKRGQLTAAEADFRAALAARPDLPETGFNLASVLQDQGRLPEALLQYRDTLAKCPKHERGHGMMLFCSNYQPDLSAEEIAAEFGRWNRTHAAANMPLDPRWDNDLDPDRRLRIGYVSPDFCAKSGRHFIEPMLRGHDRSTVEIFCYGEVPRPDGDTARLASLADHWRSTVGLSADAMGALIRHDKIDVLVDLGGHTGNNRLDAVARRPAPVRVAHFLGHGYTSGLEAMDAFLADHALVPEGSEKLFSEPVVRLPRIPLAYMPPEDMPEVAPPPALKNGHVTFGYFGRTARLNDNVIACWARVLSAAPRSRLVLNALPFTDDAVVARYRKLFRSHGVDAERIDFVYTRPQPKTWEAHGLIDIALDPFPHNAGTTTIEALWMGVPVVSLADRPSVGRFGASILGAVGLGDWVAGSIDGYVARAVEAASDVQALAGLRQGMRERIHRSPLFDGAGLARALEQVYRDLWRAHCNREATISRLHHEGAAAYGKGDMAQAVASLQQAADIMPRAELLCDLGAALRGCGRPQEAEAAYRASLQRKPDLLQALNNLANLLVQRGQADEAEPLYRRYLAIAPNDALVMRSLGVCLMSANRHDEARPVLEQALALQPESIEIRDALAVLHRQSGESVRALALYEEKRSLIETNHRATGNMGIALQDVGRWPDAEACFRKALALKPDYVSAHANLLFCLNYHPDKKAEEIFAEYRRFDAQHARKFLPAEQPARLSLNGRRLRLGLLSPDFREHSARHFIEPLLAYRDKSRIELFCYAEVSSPDATTQRFQSLADHWRSTVGLNDGDAASLIRRDRLDILMDLGGHTAASRIMAMAHKPAPIQIAYLLGHGYTSGLSAMDAFLADVHLAPEGSDHLFSEKVIRLTRIPIAYMPPEGMPEAAPLPALRKGHVTFGYFGRPERLNERVISLWSAILQRVPGSRLMLNAKAFREAAFRKLVQERFAACGIDSDRLELVYTSPQPKTWEAYGEIDIALDPFPHNAGTTTIEALWLGVPVLTLKDRPSVGRFGASILSSVGLSDWIAENDRDYIMRAVAFAHDLPQLDGLRSSLRQGFRASPLADGLGLVRELEKTFFSLCESQTDSAAVQRMQQLFQKGDLAGAESDAQSLIARDCALHDAHMILGLVAYRRKDFLAAVNELQQSIAAKPTPAAWTNLGASLRAQARVQEAEAAYAEALRLDPGFADAMANLANLLADRRDMAKAEELARQAIALGASSSNIHATLGNALYHQGRLVEAEAAFRAALARDVGDIGACRNLGSTLAALGDLKEAERCHRQALTIRPDYAGGMSSLLFNLNYRHDLTAEQIFADYKKWNDGFAQPDAAHDNSAEPNRRLRLGYVSPDFCDHVAALFALPLLEAHDKLRFEIFCYAELRNADETSGRVQSIADHWIPTTGLSDEALAARIRADGIDILVDLAGHSAGNRLAAFARKPAPVQLSYVIGHGYTTGLSAVDGFIADEVMLPKGCEPLFSEKPVRLPRVPFVYRPSAAMPEPAQLPALQNGFVTFGYFGRSVRLNDEVIAVWSAILQAVPRSRLVLNNAPFGDRLVRERFLARFADHGIAADRLSLIFTTPQPKTWAAYGEIDIALDPFPHNAGTTTIEALWMGVPVVSLADRPSVGRFGASILGAVGLADWVAHSRERYIERAVEAANDLNGVATLRASLRQRCAASALCDTKGLVAAIETEYLRFWRSWCDGRKAPSAPDIKAVVNAFAAGDMTRCWLLADQMLRRSPGHVEALHLRGLAAYRQGRSAEAASDLTEAARLEPKRAELHWNATAVLRACGRLEEAAAHGRKAIALAPRAPEAHNNLGSVYKDGGQAAEAEACFRAAIRLKPDYADAWNNLSWLLAVAGRGQEAEKAARKALVFAPSNANAYNNLGNALLQQDRLADARDCFAKAVQKSPGFVTAHSNLLFCLNYIPDLTDAEIAKSYRGWNDAHARPLMPRDAIYGNDRNPNRRLRIGYVSADFRHHAASYFIEPLLAAHDHREVEVTCYAEVPKPDALTARYREIADHWRSTVGLSDAAVADLIRGDRIDILIDLAGHTSGNRLLAFARRPAPVQLAHMIGSGTTTGLQAFDGFLTDALLAPPGSEAVFSEPLIRLPRIPLAYRPPQDMPDVGPLPALKNGKITFGCFSRVARINDVVVGVWTDILKRVPNARLVLNSKPFQEAQTRDAYAKRFRQHGIDPKRIELIYTSPQPSTWAAYGDIDIALDPFPHNAGTTTIEALWMGVPVVSLAARPPVGRFGASILSSVGMSDWCAATPGAYVERAISAAADLEGLSALRQTMRAKFSASPLSDAAGLARAIEQAFRNAWQDWLARSKPKVALAG